MNDDLKERLAQHGAESDGLDWSEMPDKPSFGVDSHSTKDWWRYRVTVFDAELAAAGYAVVPREPTEEMCKASGIRNLLGAIGIWQAMIAAAEQEQER